MPHVQGAPKRAVKFACLIAFTFSLTSTSLGEHFSRCRVLQMLVPAIPKPSATGFALHVSLRSYASAKTSAMYPARTGIPDLDFSSISGSLSNGEEFGTTVSASARMLNFKLKPAMDSSTLPHLLAWLDGWRMDMERGLFRPLRNQASRIAIAYTDIFDTRGNPDKGGHGLGILLRYDFRKAPDRR
jgi:hypothetical protein